MIQRTDFQLRRLIMMLLLLAVAAGGCRREPDHPGFAHASGRLEAEQLHIATKFAGRVIEVLVDEGDTVEADQLVARMDSGGVEADLERARAELRKAGKQREAARAVVVQRESECTLADKEFERTRALYEDNVTSESRVDQDRTRLETARAACLVAEAQVADATAAIEAAEAAAARIQEDLDEAELRAPRGGRIQYRLVEPGEVLPAGGRILTLLDLDDVSMTVFLPTAEAGRARVGAPARVLLDAMPETPLSAHVSFVASEAQFTPKEVETETERQKLSFRVEVRIDDERDLPLNAGTPGVAWIRLDEAAAWPDSLE